MRGARATATSVSVDSRRRGVRARARGPRTLEGDAQAGGQELALRLAGVHHARGSMSLPQRKSAPAVGRLHVGRGAVGRHAAGARGSCGSEGGRHALRSVRGAGKSGELCGGTAAAAAAAGNLTPGRLPVATKVPQICGGSHQLHTEGHHPRTQPRVRAPRPCGRAAQPRCLTPNEEAPCLSWSAKSPPCAPPLTAALEWGAPWRPARRKAPGGHWRGLVA